MFWTFYDDDPASTNTDNNDDSEKIDFTKSTKVTFTPEQQEFINKNFADERRKLKSKNQELITQLEAIKNNVNTSKAEKEALETRIEELRNEFTTKEQLSQQNTTKALKERDKRIKDLEGESGRWKNLFEKTTIETHIVNAAVTNKAYNPQQIVDILSNKTRLAEVLDEENKPIPGAYVPKIKLNVKDKDGKTTVLDLTVTEAVKQMTEMAEYANLFNSGATSGLGATTTRRGSGDEDTPPKDPVAYRKWRKDHPEFVGRQTR